MNKENFRKFYRKKRRHIFLKRGLLASRQLLSFFQNEHLPNYILSYASFNDEFETHILNRLLARGKKLILPKVQNKSLKCFFVVDYDKDLERNRWGILEPNPKKCVEADTAKISLILVPGLAFDQQFNRLGYGGGYYDRFLSCISKKIPKIGLGFKEQLSSKLLPRETNDFPLDRLLLF